MNEISLKLMDVADCSVNGADEAKIKIYMYNTQKISLLLKNEHLTLQNIPAIHTAKTDLLI